VRPLWSARAGCPAESAPIPFATPCPLSPPAACALRWSHLVRPTRKIRRIEVIFSCDAYPREQRIAARAGQRRSQPVRGCGCAMRSRPSVKERAPEDGPHKCEVRNAPSGRRTCAAARCEGATRSAASSASRTWSTTRQWATRPSTSATSIRTIHGYSYDDILTIHAPASISSGQIHRRGVVWMGS